MSGPQMGSILRDRTHHQFASTAPRSVARSTFYSDIAVNDNLDQVRVLLTFTRDG